MRASLLLAIVVLASFPASAGVEINTASRAELEAVSGVGPTLASSILDERRKGPFQHWSNLIARVKGLRHASAARLSAEGLTVAGEPYSPNAGSAGGTGAASTR
jgi:competence protein ComEA